MGGPSAPGQHGSQDRRNTRSTRREGLGVGGPWLWPSLSHFDLERIIKTKGGAQFIEGEPETQRRLKLPSFTQLCRCDLWGTVGRSQAWGQSLPLLALCHHPQRYREHINPTLPTLGRGTVDMKGCELYLLAGEQNKAPASYQMSPHSSFPPPGHQICSSALRRSSHQPPSLEVTNLPFLHPYTSLLSTRPINSALNTCPKATSLCLHCQQAGPSRSHLDRVSARASRLTF